jgi:hypothetical protein
LKFFIKSEKKPTELIDCWASSRYDFYNKYLSWCHRYRGGRYRCWRRSHNKYGYPCKSGIGAGRKRWLTNSLKNNLDDPVEFSANFEGVQRISNIKVSWWIAPK